MVVDKSALLDFLREVDARSEPFTIVAVGGTAMTLLGIKPSTIDIDFDTAGADLSKLKKALAAVPHGYRIDIFSEGLVFSQQLPPDYLKKSLPVAGFRNLSVRALHPLDIIVTKAGRMSERDEEDIQNCIQKFGITKTQILRRAAKVVYIGNETHYEANLQYVCRKFFR